MVEKYLLRNKWIRVDIGYDENTVVLATILRVQSTICKNNEYVIVFDLITEAEGFVDFFKDMKSVACNVWRKMGKEKKLLPDQENKSTFAPTKISSE